MSGNEFKEVIEKKQLIDILCSIDLLKYFEDGLMDMGARKGVLGEKNTKFSLLLSLVAGVLGYPTINILKGDSSTGKTNLANAITGLFETSKIGELSPTALKYMEDYDFDILYIQEITEVESNSKGLRLMSGDDGGFVAQTTVPKKSEDGFTTQESEVPVKTLVLLTTGVEMNPELMNRAITIPLDDSKKQTENVLKFYSKGSKRELNEILGKNKFGANYEQFKSVIKELKPHKILIPFEKEIMHLFPTNKTRSRRDALKFLDLIRGSCLLFQYQRPRLIINGKIMLIAVWQDLKNVMQVFYPILDSTLSGTDERDKKILSIIPEIYEKRGYITTELLVGNDIGYSSSTVRKILNDLAERSILIEDSELKSEKGIGGNTKVYKYNAKSENHIAFSENAELNWFKVINKQREWLDSECYKEQNCIDLCDYNENIFYDPVNNALKKLDETKNFTHNLQLIHLESKEEEAIKNREIDYNAALNKMGVKRSVIVKVEKLIYTKVDMWDLMHSSMMASILEVDYEIINTLKNAEHEIKLETVVDTVEAILDVSRKQIKYQIFQLIQEEIVEKTSRKINEIKDGEGSFKPVNMTWQYLKLNNIFNEEVFHYPVKQTYNYPALMRG